MGDLALPPSAKGVEKRPKSENPTLFGFFFVMPAYPNRLTRSVADLTR